MSRRAFRVLLSNLSVLWLSLCGCSATSSGDAIGQSEANVEEGAEKIDLWASGASNPRWSSTVRNVDGDRQDSVDGESFPILNGRAFFIADDETHRAALWMSDGTSNGTRILRDFSADGVARVDLLFATERAVWFWTSSPQQDLGSLIYYRSLWATDGTEQGTVRIAEEAVGRMPTVATDGSVYFDTRSQGLCRSDGTAAGTAPLGISDLAAIYPMPDGGIVAVSQIGPVYDRKRIAVWKSKGTDAPKEVALAGPITEAFTIASSPYLYVAGVGPTVLYLRDDQREHIFAIRHQGTPGSALVRDADACHGSGETLVGDDLVFAVKEGIARVGIDSTRTILADPFAGGTKSCFAVGYDLGGRFVFSSHEHLVAVDRATGGATMASSSGQSLGLVAMGARVLMNREKAGDRFSYEKVSWDGSSAAPAPLGLDAAEETKHGAFFAAVGKRGYFRASTVLDGEELFLTDGTASGTRRVTNISYTGVGSRPTAITLLGDRLLFTATDSDGDRELWVKKVTN